VNGEPSCTTRRRTLLLPAGWGSSPGGLAPLLGDLQTLHACGTDLRVVGGRGGGREKTRLSCEDAAIKCPRQQDRGGTRSDRNANAPDGPRHGRLTARRDSSEQITKTGRAAPFLAVVRRLHCPAAPGVEPCTFRGGSARAAASEQDALKPHRTDDTTPNRMMTGMTEACDSEP
jgi:hypothetical protein